MSSCQKLSYEKAQAYKQAQKEQFINYLNKVPFVKERDFSLGSFYDHINSEDFEIDGEYKPFFSFRFSTEYFDFLEKCYKHLDLQDVNGDIFKDFYRVLNYFVNLIKFDVPINEERKSFSINNGIVSSIVEIYLGDPWNEDDDCVLILLYQGYSKRDMYKTLSKFFDFIFKKYVPEGYSIFNKNLSEMTKKEKSIMTTILY